MNWQTLRLGPMLYGTCVVVFSFVVGCGDDQADQPSHSDTNAGANQAVPTVRSCEDMCARAGDCAAMLCTEDTGNAAYDGLGELLAMMCEAQCTEALVQSELTAEQWECYFQQSCRAVFERDVCRANGSYHCN